MRAKSKWGNIVLALVVIVIGYFALRQAFLCFYRAAYPAGYRAVVLEQSAAHKLEPELVFAVIYSESGFRPEAVSSVEARGLMQITKDTFEWAQYRIKETRQLHFDDLFETELNIRYGTAILSLLLEEFGTESNALCAYHAGWGNAKKWLADPACSTDGKNIENIPFGDTGRYVDKVLKTKEIYQRLYSF